MDSLIGKESSETLIRQYQNTIGNGGLKPNLFDEEANKWKSKYYDETRETSNSNEGFVEGMKKCVACDCREAANEVIKSCKDGSKESTNVVKNIITEGGNILPESTRNRIGGLFSTFNNENLETNNEWSEIYYPNIVLQKEEMKNIKETCIEFFNNSNTKQELFDILKPITLSVYNELYIYVWVICFYSILLFLLILANLILVMKLLNNIKIINLQPIQ